jgi:hypothetical protein
LFLDTTQETFLHQNVLLAKSIFPQCGDFGIVKKARGYNISLIFAPFNMICDVKISRKECVANMGRRKMISRDAGERDDMGHCE